MFLNCCFYALCSTYEPASPEVPRTVTCNRNLRLDKGMGIGLQFLNVAMLFPMRVFLQKSNAIWYEYFFMKTVRIPFVLF